MANTNGLLESSTRYCVHLSEFFSEASSSPTFSKTSLLTCITCASIKTFVFESILSALEDSFSFWLDVKAIVVGIARAMRSKITVRAGSQLKELFSDESFTRSLRIRENKFPPVAATAKFLLPRISSIKVRAFA